MQAQIPRHFVAGFTPIDADRFFVIEIEYVIVEYIIIIKHMTGGLLDIINGITICALPHGQL
jgi:hypothetical protein